MIYALNWFLVISLLILWSLAAWAFHSISAWAAANAGGLAGGAGAKEALQMPAWLAQWVPSEYDSSLNLVISFIMPAIQTVMEWGPAMAGGLSIAVWTVWAVGALLLILLGLLVTGLIAMLSRHLSSSATSSRSPAVAR